MRRMRTGFHYRHAVKFARSPLHIVIRKPPALLVRTKKAPPFFFDTSSTRKRVNIETPMIHSLASRAGFAAPFRGLPHTTGSAGGK